MVKSKVVIKNILFQIAILIAIFGGIEVFLYLFLPQIPNSSHNLGLKGGSAGYGYQPGATGWDFHPDYGRIVYEINEEGFRDKSNHIIPKPKNVKRVLLLGDSFTHGQGVGYENTYAYLLEKGLNESNGIGEYDVIKAGVQGYSTTRELALARELVPRYKPDLLLLAFLPHDLFENIDESRNENELFETAPLKRNLHDTFNLLMWLKENSQIVNFLQRYIIKIDSVYIKAYVLRNNFSEYCLKKPTQKIEKRWDITFKQLSQIKHLCEINGARFVIVSIPQRIQRLLYENKDKYIKYDPFKVDEQLAQWCDKNDVMLISILKAMVKKQETTFYFPRDGHCNDEGHKIIANSIIDELKGKI